MSNLTTNTNNTTVTQKYTLQDFCELTKRGVGLSVGQINNNAAGWKELADLWAELADEDDIDIMEDAAYWIKWGIEPVWATPAYNDLVRAVCDALLSDGPAYDAWIHHDYCAETILDTAEEFNPWLQDIGAYSFSYWHHKYTKYRMYLRIYNYRKGHVTMCKEFASFVRFFEDRIIKLLPNATSWPDEYWLNENNIFDELEKVCGFNYRNDLSSYHALLCLTTSPKRMPTTSDQEIVQCAANVKKLPNEWVKAIWPKKTDAVVVQLFSLAMERADKNLNYPLGKRMIGGYDPIPDVDYAILFQSWLYTYVNGLMENPKISDATRSSIKHAIFDVSMRC